MNNNITEMQVLAMPHSTIVCDVTNKDQQEMQRLALPHSTIVCDVTNNITEL